MNKRIVSIIQVLAESEKEYTIRDLASEYSCSERTIRNDLNSISDLCSNGQSDRRFVHTIRYVDICGIIVYSDHFRLCIICFWSLRYTLIDHIYNGIYQLV